MGDKPKNNILRIPLTGYDWKYSREPFPLAKHDHQSTYATHVHLWTDWDEEDFTTGLNTYVCASTYEPGSEPPDSELVRVRLDDFLFDSALYLLGQHLNNAGTLTFDERQGLGHFNAMVDNLASQLEASAQRIRKLALTDADIGPLEELK
jgi:hypothetical protein